MSASLTDSLAQYMDAIEAQLAAFKKEVDQRLQDVIRFRDVWRASAEYDRHDVVIHTGQLWHCNRKATAERPGTGDGWTLMSKEPAPNGSESKPGSRGRGAA